MDNYNLRGAFIEGSGSQVRGGNGDFEKTALKKTQMKNQAQFLNALMKAGHNPHIEIRRGKGEKAVTIVRYKAVKLGEDVGLFLD